VDHGCELTGDAERYGLTAAITSYNNGHYTYAVQVDHQSLS
jgi:hypothetical protein